MPDALWGGGRGHATAADRACAINGACAGALAGDAANCSRMPGDGMTD